MVNMLSIFVVLSCVTLISGRFVYVDPNTGKNTVDCLSSNSQMKPCKTLNYAFANCSNNTSFILSSGVHYLTGPLPTFLEMSKLSFIGSNDADNRTTINCMDDLSGLAFQNVAGIFFSNLTIYNCSSIRNSTSKNFHKFAEKEVYSVYVFRVGLYFFNCADVTFDFVTVDQSPYGTGVVMYDTFGQNRISNSNFTNNCAQDNPGGGGFYVEFTYCIPGDENCDRNSSNVVSYFSNNTEANYSFNNCSFVNNKAHSGDSIATNSTYIVPHRADHVAFGRGGGLSIFVKGNASKNFFHVFNCTFCNNSALWGGGLFVEFHDDTFNNTVLVEYSTMTNNFCNFKPDFGTAGGGMRIGHYVYGSKIYLGMGNYVRVFNCTFDSNAALDGGGLSISPTSEDVAPDRVAHIDIVNTTFNNNIGKLGAALHVDRFVMVLEGFILSVTLNNCTFHQNSIDYITYLQNHSDMKYNAFQTGAGAVYINQVPVSFVIAACFSMNYGSAIAAVGTGLNFSSCMAHFCHNTGNKGGAIALLGGAYIIVDDETNFMFKNNKAKLFGGAIFNQYIERENLIFYSNCFIRHVNKYLRPEFWGTNFTFHNNTDKNQKRFSAIYTTSILPCSWAGGSGISKNKKSIFCWNDTTWDYEPGNCTSQIFSDVGNISQVTNSSVEAFPGKQFTLPVTIVDDLGNSVENVTVFSATKNSGASNVFFVWDKQVILNGLENTSFSLVLDTLSERVWELNFDVEFQPCPPGFKMNSSVQSCVCAGRYVRALDCDQDQFKASITENNWIGKVEGNDSNYFVSFCPPYYCSSTQVILPNNSAAINDKLCAPNNRNNTMCGECIEHFGVAVNSRIYECVNCTSSNMGRNLVKYIAAVYIPLIVVFTLIILFNIRLTSGPANAFILYCQVISGTFELDADGQIAVSDITGNVTAHNLDIAYKGIYGVFNLNFFEQFVENLCLGFFNTLDVFLVEYSVALSPLVMIIIVLIVFKLSEYCSRCFKCRKSRQRISRISSVKNKQSLSSSILPAFAAFILLSYTKFSIISAHMLLSQPLFDENGVSSGSSRVYYAGQFSTDSYEYFPYKTIAYIVYCTFVVIPPILLLDFPRRIFEKAIGQFDCLWKYYPADKIQIFLDTFQGCFKNKMRFFAGLYFVFRLVINTAYIFTHIWFDQFLVQQIACGIMVALLAICQPYNDNYKIFNTVDILIFTNLGIINSLSNYFLSLSSFSNSTLPQLALALQYILLYLPLVYMIVYLICYNLSPYKQQIKQGCVKPFLCVLHKFKRRDSVNWLHTFAADQASQTTDHGGEHERSEGVLDEEEALLQRAQERNLYRPVTKTVVDVNDGDDKSSGIQSGATSTHSNPHSNSSQYNS